MCDFVTLPQILSGVPNPSDDGEDDKNRMVFRWPISTLAYIFISFILFVATFLADASFPLYDATNQVNCASVSAWKTEKRQQS